MQIRTGFHQRLSREQAAAAVCGKGDAAAEVFGKEIALPMDEDAPARAGKQQLSGMQMQKPQHGVGLTADAACIRIRDKQQHSAAQASACGSFRKSLIGAELCKFRHLCGEFYCFAYDLQNLHKSRILRIG